MFDQIRLLNSVAQDVSFAASHHLLTGLPCVNVITLLQVGVILSGMCFELNSVLAGWCYTP
jgi:hypothetical protein